LMQSILTEIYVCHAVLVTKLRIETLGQEHVLSDGPDQPHTPGVQPRLRVPSQQLGPS
jgi:hypothetical protein